MFTVNDVQYNSSVDGQSDGDLFIFDAAYPSTLGFQSSIDGTDWLFCELTLDGGYRDLKLTFGSDIAGFGFDYLLPELSVCRDIGYPLGFITPHESDGKNLLLGSACGTTLFLGAVFAVPTNEILLKLTNDQTLVRMNIDNVVHAFDAPSSAPSPAPTGSPTLAPSPAPTGAPTSPPTNSPTLAPSPAPTGAPTSAPTSPPTNSPTLAPSPAPTGALTAAPTQVDSDGDGVSDEEDECRLNKEKRLNGGVCGHFCK